MTSPSVFRDETIASYRYLCARAARKVLRDGLDRRDLEQIAAIGLIKATDRFNHDVGTPFKIYAWRFILGELMHFSRDQERLLRAPRRIKDLEKRYQEAVRALTVELGQAPTAREIASYAGMSDDDVRSIERFLSETEFVPFDALLPSDQISVSYTIESQADRVVLDQALGVLSDTERRVIEYLFLDELSVMDVAKKLGYSTRHIARIRQAALKKMSSFACPKAG